MSKNKIISLKNGNKYASKEEYNLDVAEKKCEACKYYIKGLEKICEQCLSVDKESRFKASKIKK